MRLALCIPARNAASTLPRLFASVSAQTRPFDEVWVYDDQSSDDTSQVAEAFGAHVVRTDHNTGPSLGKNRLAERTTCEWIHFHDADDALHPEFVERAHGWLNNTAVDVVMFGTEDRDEATGKTMWLRTFDDEALQTDSIAYNIRETLTNAGVYRRERFLAAGGFIACDATKYNEDQAMHLNLAMHGLQFRSDDYIGVVIYRRSDSMSSGNKIACARAHYHVLKQVADRTGSKYADELGAELWKLAGVCGTYRDWEYVRRTLELVRAIGDTAPS